MERARRRMGINFSVTNSTAEPYGPKVLGLMRKRLAEGYTPDDLLAVADYARSQWDAGQRFSGLKDLLWMWGLKFPAHLAAARSAGDAPNHLVYRTGKDMVDWQEGVDEMLRRQEAE